jgi:NDP-sugar pyrophosphorylase family protein
MILAAGFGTRLRPLTDNRPKALVEVAGHTLLAITLSRLKRFGIREVIINVHYLADMIVEYLRANHNFGMHIEISREDALLDTGGGLKKAAHFFLNAAGDNSEPFVLHNVDVISTIDLSRMLQFHTDQHALASLAVQDRHTSRYLLFDSNNQLCGRRFPREQRDELARPANDLHPLAFSGIHVISSDLLRKVTENGVFSIITSYLRLAGQGEKILAFRADDSYWQDLGTPENVTQAAVDAQRGRFDLS